MARGDFSTMYRIEHNSGAVLQNEIFPRFIIPIMSAHSMMQNKEHEGVILLFSTLKTMFPPLKKFIRKYDEVRLKIKECEILKDKWIRDSRRQFPILLVNKLDELYEEFWTAYHETGAGLSVKKIDPDRDRKIYNHLVGRPTVETTA